jgi:hypothetical protein
MPISNVLMSPLMQTAYQGLFGNTGAAVQGRPQQGQKKVAGRIAGITAPPQRTGSPPVQKPPAAQPYLPSSVYPYANQDANMLSSIYNTRTEADFNRDVRALQTEAQVSRENSKFKQGIDQENLTYETDEKLRGQKESANLTRQNNAWDPQMQHARNVDKANVFLSGVDRDIQAQQGAASADLTKAQTESIRRANNTFTSTTTSGGGRPEGGGSSSSGGTNGYGSYDGVNQNLATLGRLALESRVADQQNAVNSQDSDTRRLATILQGSQSGVRSYWG